MSMMELKVWYAKKKLIGTKDNFFKKLLTLFSKYRKIHILINDETPKEITNGT